MTLTTFQSLGNISVINDLLNIAARGLPIKERPIYQEMPAVYQDQAP